MKLACLLAFGIFALMMFSFGKPFTVTGLASISGPPASRTGAPGEQTCTDCHNAQTGVGHLAIVAPPTYRPGITYQVQVRHTTTDSTRKRWGFELTALASNVRAGTFANLGTLTRIVSGNNRSYIEHTSTGTFQNQTGGATWTFNWTAPATNVGPVTMYAAGLQANNNGSESGDQTYTATAVIPPHIANVSPHTTDFDGDGFADRAVFRPADGSWYINLSSNSQYQTIPFGLAGDKLTPGDFDGDGKTDVAVWRAGPPLTAGFYILQSSTNTVEFEQFGQTGDDPSVVGDWDGDGKADPAVYRDSAFGSKSYFFYRGSANNPQGTVTYLQWGTTGDRAVRGDFDGDGRMDTAVFRPSDQVWYLVQSSTQTPRYERWGLATDRIVTGDFDGDGRTDLCVFRDGIWYIRQSSDGQPLYVRWGLSTDTPITGDFDGDGRSDVGVYRSGAWYVLMSSSNLLNARQFGVATDAPVAAAFIQ
jgi:(2Fe-2S) ferredoxin